MLTIIRYSNDTYYAVDGEVKYPIAHHSGYIQEENILMKNYEEKLKEFEQKREEATYLNKVHAKKALDSEIPNWKDIFENQLKDIEYKLNHVHGFSDMEQLWKREYTFYHLNNTSIEELTKPTN